MLGLAAPGVVRRAATSASSSAAARRSFTLSAIAAQKSNTARQPASNARPTPAQRQAQWDFLLGTMDQSRSTDAGRAARSLDSAYASPVYNYLNSGRRLSKAQQQEALEKLWRESHSLPSPYKPAKPNEGRTISFDKNTFDFSAAFGQMQGIIRRNNVRSELILGDRYEKPNQRRRRLASLRHRRRFADLVRQKVQLVSSALASVDTHH